MTKSTWELATEEDRTLNIFFREYIRKSETIYTYTALDLFAAVGGYMGLFLGYSIFQLSDLISFIFQKFK